MNKVVILAWIIASCVIGHIRNQTNICNIYLKDEKIGPLQSFVNEEAVVAALSTYINVQV
jgi:hypothetical protein